jgi:hypothetical protein
MSQNFFLWSCRPSLRRKRKIIINNDKNKDKEKIKKIKKKKMKMKKKTSNQYPRTKWRYRNMRVESRTSDAYVELSDAASLLFSFFLAHNSTAFETFETSFKQFETGLLLQANKIQALCRFTLRVYIVSTLLLFLATEIPCGNHLQENSPFPSSASK